MEQDDLRAIRRWSAAMTHVCAVAALVFVAGTIWQAIGATAQSLAMWLDVPHVMLTGGQRIGVGLAIIAPAIVNAYGLFRLRASFARFASGKIFSTRAIRGFQTFAGAAAVSVAIAAVTTPVIGLWLTYDSPGGVELTIRVGSGSITLLLVSGATWVFARILMIATVMQRRNQELSQENAAFV
ncbi:MAG: hypothetical protein ABI810_18530 [Sphingomonas bacterium]